MVAPSSGPFWECEKVCERPTWKAAQIEWIGLPLLRLCATCLWMQCVSKQCNEQPVFAIKGPHKKRNAGSHNDVSFAAEKQELTIAIALFRVFNCTFMKHTSFDTFKSISYPLRFSSLDKAPYPEKNIKRKQNNIKRTQQQNNRPSWIWVFVFVQCTIAPRPVTEEDCESNGGWTRNEAVCCTRCLSKTAAAVSHQQYKQLILIVSVYVSWLAV